MPLRLFKKEETLESAGIILTFRILERIIQTVRGIIFARLLGPAEYGVFTLIFFTIPLLVSLGKMGISSCYTRYIPQYEKKFMVRDFLRRTFTLVLISASAIVIIGFFNVEGLSKLIYGDGAYSDLIILSLLIVVPYVLFENLNSAFSGFRVFKVGSLLQFSQFLVFTILGTILVYYYSTAFSAVVAFLISFLLVVPLFGILLKKYLVSQSGQLELITENRFYHKIFSFSFWFILNPIVGLLLKYTDRWMINLFLGLEAVGIYSIAVNIAGLLFMFGTIIGSALMPNLTNEWEKGKHQKVNLMISSSIKINTMFLILAGLFITVFKEPLVTLLYGESYAEGAAIIPWLLVSTIFMSMSWTIAGYAGLIEKTFIPLVANIAAFISNIILNYYLINMFGISGAASATMIAMAANFLLVSFWLHKKGLWFSYDSIVIIAAPFMLLLNIEFSAIIYVAYVLLMVKTPYLLKSQERFLVSSQSNILVLRLKKLFSSKGMG